MLSDILLLTAVNLAMFWRTLKFAYANDDWEIAKCACKKPEIVDARDGRGEVFKMCKTCGLKQRSAYRNLWHKLSLHFFGIEYSDSRMAHAMTLGVHMANTTLIYLAFGWNNISLLSAMIFAVHPVATQGSSVWLSGRNYGTATLIALLMRWLPPLTPLFYLLSFRFALIGAPGPAMFIRSFWWFWILLIPGMIILMKDTVRKSTEMKYVLVSQTRKPFDWPNIILFFKTVGYYFCICLVPTHLGVHHTYLERYGLTKEETKATLKIDGFFFLGIILCLLGSYLFFWHWGNPITYGMTWFFIFLLPWSNICTIHQAVTERYIVLSLVGLMFAMVNLIATLPLLPACALYFIIIGYYICRTQIYLRIYRDILTCAEENTRNFEDSAAAWRWRGGLERNLGLGARAFESWMQAWRLRPYDFVLNNNIAAYLAGQGRLDEAQKFIDLAKQCPLPSPELKEKWDKRMKQFQDVLETDRNKRDALRKVGRNDPCPCGSGKKFKKCCRGK